MYVVGVFGASVRRGDRTANLRLAPEVPEVTP